MLTKSSLLTLVFIMKFYKENQRNLSKLNRDYKEQYNSSFIVNQFINMLFN